MVLKKGYQEDEVRVTPFEWNEYELRNMALQVHPPPRYHHHDDYEDESTFIDRNRRRRGYDPTPPTPKKKKTMVVPYYNETDHFPQFEENAKENENCTICMDSIPPSELFLTRCNHTFHSDCLRKWIESCLDDSEEGKERMAVCPVCRSEI